MITTSDTESNLPSVCLFVCMFVFTLPLLTETTEGTGKQQPYHNTSVLYQENFIPRLTAKSVVH